MKCPQTLFFLSTVLLHSSRLVPFIELYFKMRLSNVQYHQLFISYYFSICHDQVHTSRALTSAVHLTTSGHFFLLTTDKRNTADFILSEIAIRTMTITVMSLWFKMCKSLKKVLTNLCLPDV